MSHRAADPGAAGTPPGPPPDRAAAETRFRPPTPEQVGRAAAVCFRDAESDEQIARRLGIVRRTLARWKTRPDFAAAIAALAAWQDISREGSSSSGPRNACGGGTVGAGEC